MVSESLVAEIFAISVAFHFPHRSHAAHLPYSKSLHDLLRIAYKVDWSYSFVAHQAYLFFKVHYSTVLIQLGTTFSRN